MRAGDPPDRRGARRPHRPRRSSSGTIDIPCQPRARRRHHRGHGCRSTDPVAVASHIITPTCPCDPSSVNRIDRTVIGNASDAADRVSTATVAAAIIGPPLADWIALRDVTPWLEDVVVFTEANSVKGALATAAKYSVQRPIPRVYSGTAAANDPGNYRAFYSGHTSLAFAALSTASVTMNRRYGLTWQPWVATAVVGASVAMERVLS